MELHDHLFPKREVGRVEVVSFCRNSSGQYQQILHTFASCVVLSPFPGSGRF